jgi:electron transfer flavoprotein beta subunit
VSPYDEFAVEAALRLKDAAGGGETIVVDAGRRGGGRAAAVRAGHGGGPGDPAGRRGLAGRPGGGPALASELKELEADLILFGMKATDDDQQQVGPMVAELLGLPCVTVVSEVQAEEGKVVCHREVEGGTEVVEVELPAVVTMTKGPYEPRYPSLKGIMAAKKKPLEEKPVEVPPSRIKVRRYSEPPARPEGKIVGEGPDAVPELVRLLRDEAKVL